MNNHLSVRLKENLGAKIDEIVKEYSNKLGLDLSRNYVVNLLLSSGYELERDRLQSIRIA